MYAKTQFPLVNFRSVQLVSFQSAPTHLRLDEVESRLSPEKRVYAVNRSETVVLNSRIRINRRRVEFEEWAPGANGQSIKIRL